MEITEHYLYNFINTTEDWDKLKKRFIEIELIKENITKEQFVDFTRSIWGKINNYIDVNVFPFPNKKVSLNGINYFICGLIHGNPFFSLTEEFKSEVNKKLSDLEIICEDGFIEWIKGAHSFKEIEYFKLNEINFFDIFKNTIYFLTHKIFGKLNPLEKEVKLIKTKDDLIRLRKILFRNYLPEPLGLNSLLYIKGKRNIKDVKENIPLRLKRYIYEAKEAIRYAEKNSLKELYILVGCAHELPLEYLIKNRFILEKIHV